MFLQTNPEWFDLFEKYKIKGVIKKYDDSSRGACDYEQFEWVQKELNWI